jgi:hypothetical protein
MLAVDACLDGGGRRETDQDRLASTPTMHSAEHRAIRELHATTRQLRNHWTTLATKLDDPFLEEGAREAGALLDELEQYNPQGRPAAQGVGTSLAGARFVSDLFLERNQAFRSALLDLNHVTTLLLYLVALGRIELEPWVERFAALEVGARERVMAIAADPDAAIVPADGSALGRAGAKLGVTVGTVGEAIDNSPIGRLARRRAT